MSVISLKDNIGVDLKIAMWTATIEKQRKRRQQAIKMWLTSRKVLEYVYRGFLMPRKYAINIVVDAKQL